MTSGQVASITRRPRAGRVRVHRRRDAVRREDDRRALRHVVLGVDEDRAAPGQLGHHVTVVDDLLAHVDGLAGGQLERPLDGLDGAVDAGAVAARGSEEEATWVPRRGVYPGAVRAPSRPIRGTSGDGGHHRGTHGLGCERCRASTPGSRDQSGSQSSSSSRSSRSPLVALATSVVAADRAAACAARAPLADGAHVLAAGTRRRGGIGAIAVLAESRIWPSSRAPWRSSPRCRSRGSALLRREHGALVGGNAAVSEARGAARAALRALVAATRLAERLDGALVAGRDRPAAVRRRPRARCPTPSSRSSPATSRTRARSSTCRSAPASSVRSAPPGRRRRRTVASDVSAAEVVLRALASEAALGVERLHGRQRRRGRDPPPRRHRRAGRRGCAVPTTRSAPCHLAAQAAGSELGARYATIEATGVHATFTLDGDRAASTSWSSRSTAGGR